MKEYRKLAEQSSKDRMARITHKENEPEGLKIRGDDINEYLATSGKPRKKHGGEVEGVHGKKAHKRLDKYARGGSVKKGSGKTTVNVVIAGQGGQQQPPAVVKQPVPVPVPAQGAGMPPRPPMGGPPPMAGGPGPGMGAPMPPPGGMPQRPFKRGGKVMEAGAGSGEGRLEKIGKKAKPANFDGVANRI